MHAEGAGVGLNLNKSNLNVNYPNLIKTIGIWQESDVSTGENKFLK